MRRTPQQWLTLFETQSESHLSVKQFCLEQGISTSNVYKNKCHKQLDYIPAKVTVLNHVRRKYICLCCNDYFLLSKFILGRTSLSNAIPSHTNHIIWLKPNISVNTSAG